MKLYEVEMLFTISHYYDSLPCYFSKCCTAQWFLVAVQWWPGCFFILLYNQCVSWSDVHRRKGITFIPPKKLFWWKPWKNCWKEWAPLAHQKATTYFLLKWIYLLRTSGQSVNLKVEGLQLKIGGHKMFLLTLASLVWTSCCFIRIRARLGTIQSNIPGVPHHLHEQSCVSRFVVISVV